MYVKVLDNLGTRSKNNKNPEKDIGVQAENQESKAASH